MKNKYIIFFKSFIFIVGIISIILINGFPEIKLSGNNIVELEVYNEYQEEGYTASSFFQNITNKVQVKSELDTTKIGNYNIIYTLDYGIFNVSKKRIVTIKDNEKPIINLLGDTITTICPTTEYVENGYEVIDNYDKNLDDKVIITKNKNEIIYTVSDSSGNQNSITRKIIYSDTEKPNINLNGDQVINIYEGSSYNEPGYKASDNCDGDITSKVTVNGNVDINKTGSYILTYSVTDSSGNNISTIRTVNVIKKVNYISGTGKIIYLTFDDGPSATITPSVLQILKEENVKATFFVINKDNSLNYLIKQASLDGHTIALHSSTHNYSYIYSSPENYFNDLYTIENKVYDITGKKSKIIRFPGGSSNTVSRNYYSGIMTYLTNEVTNRGYIYFDWNVSSGDAGGARTADDVYYNVTKNLIYSNNIVLLHDFENNYKTLNALRNIIKYGKNNGYTFAPITSSTPPSRHRVNN